MNSNMFYLEDDNRIKVDFIGDTILFTIILIESEVETRQYVILLRCV